MTCVNIVDENTTSPDFFVVTIRIVPMLEDDRDFADSANVIFKISSCTSWIVFPVKNLYFQRPRVPAEEVIHRVEYVW